MAACCRASRSGSLPSRPTPYRVRDDNEREKLRMLYSSPVTEGTAATRLAKKLAGRRE